MNIIKILLKEENKIFPLGTIQKTEKGN